MDVHAGEHVCARVRVPGLVHSERPRENSEQLKHSTVFNFGCSSTYVGVCLFSVHSELSKFKSWDAAFDIHARVQLQWMSPGASSLQEGNQRE